MKSKYDISVILPTYNEAENIVPLIFSIIKNLPEESCQIIVVDDNSPDNTGDIVNRKFRHKKNREKFKRGGKDYRRCSRQQG